jgi:hypothetical protein
MGSSALLGVFARSPANAGRNRRPEALFPAFYASEGAARMKTFALRPSQTFVSQITYGTPYIADVEFVFETFTRQRASRQSTTTHALSILVVPVEGSSTLFTIPAYDRSKYAAASQSLAAYRIPSGNYFDPAHGGEESKFLVGSDTGTVVSSLPPGTRSTIPAGLSGFSARAASTLVIARRP